MNKSKFKYYLMALGFVSSFVASADNEKQLNDEGNKQTSIEVSEKLNEKDQIEKQDQERIEKQREEQELKKAKSVSKDQVFIPTEEISEDKPVPFPVDI